MGGKLPGPTLPLAQRTCWSWRIGHAALTAQRPGLPCSGSAASSPLSFRSVRYPFLFHQCRSSKYWGYRAEFFMSSFPHSLDFPCVSLGWPTLLTVPTPGACAGGEGRRRGGGRRCRDSGVQSGVQSGPPPHAAGTVSAANKGGRPPGKEPQRLLGELWMCSFDSYRQHGYPFRRRGHRLRKGLAAGWVTTKGRAEVQV